jgi:hypothetical protein
MLLIDRADLLAHLAKLLAVQVLNLGTVDPELAGGGPKGKVEDAKQGGFASAARPNQRYPFSALHREVDAADGKLVTVEALHYLF